MLSNLLNYKKFMLQNKKQKAMLGILLKENVNGKKLERKSKKKMKIELILTYYYYYLF